MGSAHPPFTQLRPWPHQELLSLESGPIRSLAPWSTTWSRPLEIPRNSSTPLEYQWNLRSNCPPQFRGHELKLTKHRSKLEVRRAFLYGTTSQQMEQFGSSHSECKYREQFQEWSATTETISDGFLRGLKSDWLHRCFNKTGVATPGKWTHEMVAQCTWAVSWRFTFYCYDTFLPSRRPDLGGCDKKTSQCGETNLRMQRIAREVPAPFRTTVYNDQAIIIALSSKVT